jgi:muramoyltetrapeptide carboxypeptidase
MIRPARLQAGDSVGIVATGRKVSPDDIKHAVDILESWGLTIVAAPHLHSSEHAYLAASDEHRLHDLQHMIDDPQIRAVLSEVLKLVFRSIEHPVLSLNRLSSL